MMSNKVSSIILMALGILLTNCSRDPMSSEIRELTELEKSLVESSSTFGLDLFRKIAKEDQGNTFISPLSVSMALGMTLNGADGATKAAMEQTLELAGMTTEQINQSYKSLIDLLTEIDPETVFQIANSIWYREDRDFQQEFIRTNQDFFNALVRALDFNDPTSVDIINNWVNENTNGKIKEILESIDPSTVMFLINAIYFNGTWVYEFDKELTRDDLFQVPDGSQKEIKMMVQTNEFGYLENDDFQAVDLPYGNGNFSMTVFLPRPGKAVDSLVEQLNDANWNDWLTSLARDSVTLELPKFKLEYDIKLNDILDVMGMGCFFRQRRFHRNVQARRFVHQSGQAQNVRGG